MGYQSVFAKDSFADQIVIVTGGGSGMGRCTAHELASLGAKVVVMGRTIEKLEAVVAEIQEDGGQADCLSVDIRDEGRVIEAIAEVIQRHGRIDGLVNNAGGQFPAMLEQISANGFETVVRNNLVGGFLMAREVYKQYMKEHGGAIVNITADCVNGFPTMGHTGAARAGMENLTKTAAWEWGEDGVRVNAVAPGFIASSGLDTYDPKTQDKLRKVQSKIPLRRMGVEAEISAAICFLLSKGAGYINGHTIRVDGGSQFASSDAYWPLPDNPGRNHEPFEAFHRYTMPDFIS